MREPDSEGRLFNRLPLSSSSVALGSLLLSLVAGCGPETASRPSATIRDSAGVTIVENQQGIPPDAGGWSLAARPSLVIGSLHEPEDNGLYRVRGALRLPDGRIAVGSDGSHELRIYEADGALVRRLGGEGEGPG